MERNAMAFRILRLSGYNVSSGCSYAVFKHFESHLRSVNLANQEFLYLALTTAKQHKRKNSSNLQDSLPSLSSFNIPGVLFNNRWDVDVSSDCCSEFVEIIFCALVGLICEIAEKAFKYQGRCVKSDWLDLMSSVLTEVRWSITKSIPTIDDYMANGIGGRLIKDIQRYKWESEQGKVNAIPLRVVRGNGAVTEEELLRRVLQEKGSIVPRACKDLFWTMTKVL
ncbi:hypothetical protein L6164_018099 [Bauhinia variegata]|uniref:Uncharacterized protein n=1 Tax=Bauhinia variegata TaxID=167791 RepID=A0ACB9N9X5_BAUVA|nr:hypothetical protein L6164_018099 [Bauhinia variegata]